MERKEEVIDYFIEAATAKFERVEQRFDRIDAKLEQLIGFRWMLIGSAMAVSSIVSVVIAVYFHG